MAEMDDLQDRKCNDHIRLRKWRVGIKLRLSNHAFSLVKPLVVVGLICAAVFVLGSMTSYFFFKGSRSMALSQREHSLVNLVGLRAPKLGERS